MVLFGREFKQELQLRSGASFFTLSLAFNAPVDPQSGMSINLVVVDGWVHELQLQWSTQTFADATEFLSQAWVSLSQKGRLEFVSLKKGNVAWIFKNGQIECQESIEIAVQLSETQRSYFLTRRVVGQPSAELHHPKQQADNLDQFLQTLALDKKNISLRDPVSEEVYSF